MLLAKTFLTCICLIKPPTLYYIAGSSKDGWILRVSNIILEVNDTHIEESPPENMIFFAGNDRVPILGKLKSFETFVKNDQEQNFGSKRRVLPYSLGSICQPMSRELEKKSQASLCFEVPPLR